MKTKHILEVAKELADMGLLGKPWASPFSIRKQFALRRLEVAFTARSSAGHMGRFGGGWNWKLGVQIGGTTALFSLLIAELSITIHKSKAGPRK